ncbi:related to Elongator complex protein 5 [Zygosaccharomyces bailii ISA1307]|nr:related to Elongator complex protein 5 [Zygosaccharomyces bailii ISA1307]
MASLNSNATILLKRVLNLSEYSPLILCIDSIAQSARHLIDEILYNANSNSALCVVYVSFESVNCPSYATHFIDVELVGMSKLAQTVSSYLPSSSAVAGAKSLVIIDSMNYIPKTHISQFMASVGSRHATVLGVYHRDLPEVADIELEHYPSSLSLLFFMATTVLEVNPILNKEVDEEEVKEDLERTLIPRSLNNARFLLTLTNRRKSGRSLIHKFYVDSSKHFYETVMDPNHHMKDSEENPEALQDLTTFNLSTSAKQKLAKESVNLPFLEAQSFSTGGAIVYQFEKDDDYDEEDSYEDPF